MNHDQTSPTVIVGLSPQPAAALATAHATALATALATQLAGRRDLSGALPWFDAAAGDDASLTVMAPAGFAGVPGALHPDIASGRLIDEGEIARGGMGSIHSLYDTLLRRHVALKAIDAGLAADPYYAQRFVNEARVTGALGHPNIVPVHDLVSDGSGRASYTMKRVEGRTLTALIGTQSSRRDLERILHCLASVCDALAFAHSRGIIHRDLKPDNIMVGEFGEVYLMDWGCALAVGVQGLVEGDVDPEGTVAGTPRYMAPEQARGEIHRIDARSDVFAVGAILYKALTGQAPYTAARTDDVLAAAAEADFRPIGDCSGMAVKPPPMLSAIVTKAMASDPAQRHQSAAELAEDLRDFLRGGNWYALHVFPAGHLIVREGEAADAAYLIKAGRCEVFRRDPLAPRRRLTLRVLEAGDVFGETAIFADAPRSASVVALDEVSAVVVDRASLEHLADSTTLGQFVKALAQRFLELDRQR